MTKRHTDLFKLPNDIFHKGLSASELTVLAVVYSLRSRVISKGKKRIKINQKAIAKLCGFKSTATVSKAIDKLCRIGYIERIDRYYSDYKKLGTYIYTIPVVSGRKFFFVNRRVFNYKLTVAQMRMYLYCCKCATSHSKRFWNSYNDICQELNLKRSAVIKTISELISVGLIKKYKVRKKDGSYSDNHYKVVALKAQKLKIGRKKRRCRPHSIFKKIYVGFVECPTLHTILIRNFKKVNTKRNNFFDLRGSPKILSSLYSTHLYTHRRKNKIRLYLKYRCNLTIYSCV